jgi:Na+/H+ antiporter NhaC
MSRRALALVALLFSASPISAEPSLTIEPTGAVLRHIRVHLEVTGSELPPGGVEGVVLIDGRPVQPVTLVNGKNELILESASLPAGSHTIAVQAGGLAAETSVSPIPGWLSIVPPLLAIVLALLFRDVIIALSVAIFSGALIFYDWNPLTAFARAVDRFVVGSLADADHAKIIVFSMMLGGMVGLISRSGGTEGIVHRIRGFATTARRGQLSTWLMGVFIFFDDYANTLIVGTTMRPVTDRLRISREKLAYIVDSTAAPIASLVPISTWIGFEVGLIIAAFQQIGFEQNAYLAFIDSIPYRFYPIFALVLGFTIAFACRDFGPMLKAELRASETGKVIADGDVPLADYTASGLAAKEGIPLRARNAIVPMLVVIGVALGGMYASGAAGLNRGDYGGTGEWLREVFGNAASLDALLWASLGAVVVAVVMAVAQKILTLKESMGALIEGFKSMLLAIIVLILAWAIGDITGVLHTADWVVSLTESVLSPRFLPVLVFLASAVIAFSTGTSWGTMAILMPLVIPIAHRLSIAGGHAMGSDLYYLFMLGTISSVLAGSVWGDHCSPISDTTILSSMGSGCDHIAHVKTQLPYAVAIGVVGMLLGDLPTAFGLNPWISIVAGTVLIVAVVMIFGKRSDWPGAAGAAETSPPAS